MTFRLARNVFELLRGTARPRSLEGLRREGRRNVPVLKFSELEALLQASVDDTLQRLGLELGDKPMQGLNEEARLRFLALLKEREDLRQALEALRRQGDRLEASAEGVRAEIERAEDELAARRAAAPSGADEDIEAFRTRLRTGLAGALEGVPGADAATAARLLAAVDAEVEAWRIRMTSRARHEQAAHVEQLERRLHRLRRKLEESEALLRRARETGAQGLPALVELGPALAPGDADYRQKRGLLDEVFKLNLELRKMIGAKD